MSQSMTWRAISACPSALAERLALPALYSGMAGVASAMLGSLEKHLGAAPGSLSGLMDVCDQSGAMPPDAPPPVRPDYLFMAYQCVTKSRAGRCRCCRGRFCQQA
jgi:hypothetical protein